MRLDSKVRATRDFFAYFLAYYPQFPPEDEMDRERSFRCLVEGVENAEGGSQDPTTLHWLALCKQQLADAREAHAAGTILAVEKAVRSAREFFEYAIQRRTPVADFVVGPSGNVKKT